MYDQNLYFILEKVIFSCNELILDLENYGVIPPEKHKSFLKTCLQIRYLSTRLKYICKLENIQCQHNKKNIC